MEQDNNMKEEKRDASMEGTEGKLIILITVKPRLKAPQFNANPDLTRLIPLPQNISSSF
jgi:hypothetical protein